MIVLLTLPEGLRTRALRRPSGLLLPVLCRFRANSVDSTPVPWYTAAKGGSHSRPARGQELSL